MEETKLCPKCKLPEKPFFHVLDAECMKAMESAMTALLKNVGQLGTCKGCNAPVVWITHRNGKHVPYTTEGLNHFVDCPQREQFGKKSV